MTRLHRRSPDRIHPARSHADGMPEPQPCPAHAGQGKLARCLACISIFCGACHPGPCPTCGILPCWGEEPRLNPETSMQKAARCRRKANQSEPSKRGRGEALSHNP